MKLKQKIGVIGVGNMGGAILEGLFRKKIATPSQVWTCDKIEEKVQQFTKEWKTQKALSPGEVAGATDVLILSIKPQDLESMRIELKPYLKKGHTLITILAGTPLTKIRELLGEKPSLVRAMPNLGAKVGEAITALTGTNPESLKLAEIIFSGCGKTLQLSESHFDLVTAVSGSGPAYFFLLMELLARFAQEAGLAAKEARLLAIQTGLGAARLAQSSSFSPEELRQQVTSRGGTTEAALNVLEKEKFGDIFFKALKAALDRGRELSHR